MNSEELENVIHQQRADQDIQSFLVQLRILSTKSWDAVYQLFLFCSDDSFILFGLAAQLRFTDVLKIQWIMLETIRSFDPREKGLWLTTLKVVGTLIRTLTDELERNDPLLYVNITGNHADWQLDRGIVPSWMGKILDPRNQFQGEQSEALGTLQ